MSAANTQTMSRLGPSGSLINANVSLDRISERTANTISGAGFILFVITHSILKKSLAVWDDI